MRKEQCVVIPSLLLLIVCLPITQSFAAAGTSGIVSLFMPNLVGIILGIVLPLIIPEIIMLSRKSPMSRGQINQISVLNFVFWGIIYPILDAFVFGFGAFPNVLVVIIVAVIEHKRMVTKLYDSETDDDDDDEHDSTSFFNRDGF